MRLSEKSIELNFCHQMSAALDPPVWWFGTTQKQEKNEGWDVTGQIAGAWILFQLKASNQVLANGRRRFRGHHHQLVELKARATSPLLVFYVFPTLGTTPELVAAGFDLLPHVRLLDVFTVPAGIAPPTTASGTLRKSELHYFDLHADTHGLTIHSDPIEVQTTGTDGLGADVRGLTQRGAPDSADFATQAADQSREFLLGGRNRVAAFLPLG